MKNPTAPADDALLTPKERFTRESLRALKKLVADNTERIVILEASCAHRVCNDEDFCIVCGAWCATEGSKR